MKIIFTLFIIILCNCCFAQTTDSTFITYYSTGQVKEKGYLNKAGLKTGEFLYYSANGNLDSSITFKNGKLNGLKKIYYSDDDIFCFEYHNNKLLSHKIFDSTNQLKYESPLDIKNIQQTKYWFASGRNYYNSGKTDTLLINQDVPYLNQYVYFPGATIQNIGRYAWEIIAWNPQPNTKSGKMVVDVTEYNFQSFETASKKSRTLRHEVFLVPIK